jgi:hypothetical protein
MNENHEQPKATRIKVYETDFFRVIGPQKWHPSLSVGPFLPITSNGEGNLPYKLADVCGSTQVDYTQKLVSI